MKETKHYTRKKKVNVNLKLVKQETIEIAVKTSNGIKEGERVNGKS